jgi:hypothetical protein
MKNYKKLVLEKNYRKLLLYDIADELTNKEEYSNHVDWFMVENKSKREHLLEGIKIFKTLIDICIENGWVNDFIPEFIIYLKGATGIKHPNEDIASIKNLLKILHNNTPPELFMRQKVMYTCTSMPLESRTLYFPKTAVEELFNESFDENICMYYFFYRMSNEKIYTRHIGIKYNHYVKEIKYHKRTDSSRGDVKKMSDAEAEKFLIDQNKIAKKLLKELKSLKNANEVIERVDLGRWHGE